MSKEARGAAPDVLIVGGGPVGLSLAIELRQWGMLPLVVERRLPDALTHPTANHLSVRTLELLRRWGLSEAARYAGFPPDWAGALGIYTHIGGYELAHLPRPCARDPHRHACSPEAEVWQPKRFFDPVLREAAVDRGAILRSGVEVTSLEQDAEGVTAQLTDLESGEVERVRAAFAVGCDGANSRVRDWIGEALEGLPPEDAIDSVYFRSAGLAKLLPRDRWQYRILGRSDGPDAGWLLITIDGQELWRLHGPGVIVHDDPGATEANLRRLAGADIDVEVITMAPWQPRQAVCASFRSSRIFLAGDAAARGTTFGGMWMNRGIADAVDLGWKLAAVMQGWGGDRLLDSYSEERRLATLDLLRFQGADLSGPEPVQLESQKFGHAGLLAGLPSEFWSDAEEAEDKRRALREAFSAMPAERTEWTRADLGYRYDGSPVLVDDGTPIPKFDGWGNYEQSAKPGGRAPHVWTEGERSSLDWYASSFTIVDTGGGPETLLDAARTRGVPVRVVRSDAAKMRAAYGQPLTLVRPDGFVAWRGDGLDAEQAIRVIDTVRGA